MLNCIYDIFLTSEKNNCDDLVVQAQPMLLSDVKNNTRNYVSDETDISMLHEYSDEIHAQSGEVSKFIGKHYDCLVDAFQLHDRSKFNSVVEDCIKADIEDAKKDGDVGEVD